MADTAGAQMDLSNYETYPHFPKVDHPVTAVKNFYQFMNQRRTIRDFDSTPIDPEILKNALAAAGTAPSGANTQPWKFVVVQNPELQRRIREEAEEVERSFYQEKAPEKWLNAIRPLGTDENKEYLENAPALIAVFSVHSHCDTGTTYYPLESTGLATGLLIAALHHAGLATLTHTPNPMKFLNQIFGLGLQYKPYLLLVTGYPKNPILVPKIKRKPINEYTIFV